MKTKTSESKTNSCVVAYNNYIDFIIVIYNILISLIIILLKEIAKKHITIYNQGTTEGNFTENQGFLLSDNL